MLSESRCQGIGELAICIEEPPPEVSNLKLELRPLHGWTASGVIEFYAGRVFGCTRSSSYWRTAQLHVTLGVQNHPN